MFVKVELEDVIDNPFFEAPFLVLKEKDGQRCCTIDVGLMEATIIANQCEGVVPPRPMPHDLMVDALTKAGASVKAVYIESEKSHTYYATVHIENKSSGVEQVDARPSDAILLALKENCPIYLNERLFTGDQCHSSAKEPDVLDALMIPLLKRSSNCY